jgi:hypothetical protein
MLLSFSSVVPLLKSVVCVSVTSAMPCYDFGQIDRNDDNGTVQVLDS